MSRILRIGLPLVVVSLLLVSPALAAGVPGAGVSFGVKAGLNIATVSNLEGIGYDQARTGLVGGGFLKAALGPVNLQVEGLFSQRGTQTPEVLGEPVILKLDYLDVPVLVRFDLPSPAVNVFFYAGPVFSILLSAEEEFPSETFDVKEFLNTSDVGLAVGVGVEMSKVSLELRYTLGMTGIVEDPDPTEDDAKNRTISAMVGFTLF